ncbi:MAG TPA: HAD-IIIA family hydrolase [Anaerolineales bacterium]|nr:HAD-IIIA family hydrolase [Anaerolineales bacterium]
MRPAIFLDRDGVIIENCPNYVRSLDDVQIFEQAVVALAKIRTSPFAIIVVTNQSAVGRGIISIEQAHSINTHVVQAIVQAGGRIDRVYMCPHVPGDDCNCRKPRPGMLLQASKELSIDLAHSIMIGDAFSDLLAGQAAGVGKLALVRTGRGAVQEQKPVPAELEGYAVYDALADAFEHLVVPPV